MKRVFIIILLISLLFIAGCGGNQATGGVVKENPLGDGKLSIKAEKNNQFGNGEYVNDFYTYNYDCKWSELNVKCDGEIQYVGSPDMKVEGAVFRMFCKDKEGCLIDDDSVDIKSQDKQIYTLLCSIGSKINVEVELGIGEGLQIITRSTKCAERYNK